MVEELFFQSTDSRAQAHWLWYTGLVALPRVGSSGTMSHALAGGFLTTAR